MNLLNRIKEKILSIILLRMKSSGYYAVRSIFKDLKVLVNKDNPFIIDGGANIGETTEMFLSQYKNPTIYCLEANQALENTLKDKFKEKENVHIIIKAFGNKTEEVSFNISNNHPSSSFLEITDLNRAYHGNLTERKEEKKVPMVKLEEEFFASPIIDILKLDVEGYELEILKGAEKILPKIRIIMAEVWFADDYKNAPYFSDVEKYLRENNFILLNLYNPYTHKDMQLTVADAVFLNKKFFGDRKHFG